jgi:hypothetical protein
MSFLKKLFDQANPFDNGKTWSNPQGNPQPVKQAPAQTPAPGGMNFAGSKTYGTFNRPSPVVNLAQKQIAQTPKVNTKNRYAQVNAPSYGSGLSGLLNRAKDVVDANTAQDRFKRVQTGRPEVVKPLQQQATQIAKPMAQGIAKPFQQFGNALVEGNRMSYVDLPKAIAAQASGNKQAMANVTRGIDQRLKGPGTFGAGMPAGFTSLNQGSKSFIDDPAKVKSMVGTGVQIGTTVAPMGKGFTLGSQVFSQPLKETAKTAIRATGANAALSAGGSAGMQLSDTGKIDLKQLAKDTAFGTAIGTGLPFVAGATTKAASKGAKPIQNALNRLSIDNQIGAVGKNVKDNLDPLEALKAEARKYKSAEEFVKNNFVAHGTNREISGNLQPTNGWYGKAVYTTDDLANASGRNGGGVTYFVNKPQGKLLEINAHGSKGGSDFTPQQYQDAIKNGYDGLKIKHDNGKTWYAMFNEQTPHTKQQLTDLYNQATQSRNPFKNQGGFAKNPFYKDPQVGKTGASKAELGDTSLQSPEPVVQKTPQTQPNLSQAKNNADGLATGTEKSLQQKAGKAANNQTNLESGNTSTSTKQQRGFKSNIAKDTETPLSVYKDIPGYNVKPNKQTIGKAAERVAKDPEGTYDRLLKNGIQQTDDSADALVLLRNLVEKDELDKASKLARATAKAGTDFGQAVQIFSAFRKTTPDGALRDAWNIVNAYNTKNPKKTPIRISAEQSKRIVDLANDLQTTEYGTREWAKKAALLEREKGLLTPNSFLSKVSTVQTMAQLLNPKTAIRNILGNGVLDLAEDLSRLPAVGIDKALKGLGLIDERNMVLPNMKTNWANKLIGFKQGVEDVNLGIRTTGAAGNYDLTKEVFKPGSVGNKLEKLLGYELSSMDKAFYTGRYQSSLENMMKAQKVKVPTPEMKASAEAEALYATFQNNSALSKGLQKGKNALNAGKEWGLGDFILKYPKTPGNIVNVGLDYSPVGFVKGLKSLHDGIKLKNIQTIRNGELLLGRSLVGSGLIAGGAFLAKQGIITGKQDGDFDKASADRDLGKGPFTFNITALGRLLKGEDTKARPGDITANYDWLQPNAIQLSMGANMIINNNSATQQINTNLESLGAGIDTISEQPVFKGVKDFVGDLNSQQGGGIGKAAQGIATNSLSSFVPSLVNQLGQQFDNTKRSTYSDTPVGEAANKVKGRIPGARNTLYPSLNTLGNEQKQYDVGGNNPFNVFFNPAFLNRVKDEPSLQLADDLNKKTGETSQYPRSLTGNQTIDGVKTKLTPEQLFSLKKNVGQTTNNIFQQYAASPIFQNLSDTEKVNALSGALTDINAAGKASLAAKNSLGQFSPGFTGKPTKLSGSQKALLSNEYSVDTKLAGTNIPKGLNQDAVKVIASYDKAKAKEIANNPTVTKALTDWNSGRPVPQITNEVAKQWADYEKGLKDGSITKLEAKDQKIKILRNAFNSQLNDDEKQLYKLSKTKIQSALSEGLITEDNVRRALAIEKQMFDNGLLDSETLAKKLGLGSRSKSSGKSSGTRRSSGRRSTRTAKAPKLKFTTTRVKNRQKSFNSSLRKLLASAKV